MLLVLSRDGTASKIKFVAEILKPAQRNPEKTWTMIRNRGFLLTIHNRGKKHISNDVDFIILIYPTRSACIPHLLIVEKIVKLAVRIITVYRIKLKWSSLSIRTAKKGTAKFTEKFINETEMTNLAKLLSLMPARNFIKVPSLPVCFCNGGSYSLRKRDHDAILERKASMKITAKPTVKLKLFEK